MASSGDILTYTLTLTVSGSTASGVHVSDPLPSHLIYLGLGPVTMGGTGTWDQSTKTLTWDWASLAPGTYTVTYQAQVDDYVTQGSVLVNNATLTYNGSSNSKQATVSVTLATLYLVHVAVYNETGELVKEVWVKEMPSEVNSFSLDSSTITSVHGMTYVVWNGVQLAAWDGTNQAGDPVSNGKYFVKVDNSDSLGVVSSTSQLVMVNRTIAKVSVNVFNEAGEIVRHLTSWVDDPNNISLNNVQFSTSVLQPSAGGTTGGNSTVAITAQGGLTLVWDGRSDSGSIVTNGRYQLEVSFVDGKGGNQVVTQGIIVESSNQPLNGKVVAAPNLIQGGATNTLIKINSTTAYTLTASLYDTAGELVKRPVTGTAGAGSVSVDLTGVASGLYFVRVDLTGAQGGVVAEQFTQIIVQR